MARDQRIDSLKGLLIILVVLGHVIIWLDNVNRINHAVMGLIYVFHMPLFILLSGYFTKAPGQQTTGSMWRGVLKIFITLAIFHSLSALWVLSLDLDFIQALLTFPYGTLWYLFSLICWRIVLYYTPKALLDKPALHLGIALAVSIVSGLTHLGNFMAIQRTLNFYVFFLLGYYYRQGVLPAKWWENNILHSATVVVLLPLVFWLFPRCGYIMNGADYYGMEGIPPKVIILICSVAMSLLVYNVMPNIGLLRGIGKDTLFYYVYHAFLVDALFLINLWYFKLPTSLPFMVLYTAIIMITLWLMSKVKLLRWLVHPTWGNKWLKLKG